jgi:hypothetical protein
MVPLKKHKRKKLERKHRANRRLFFPMHKPRAISPNLFGAFFEDFAAGTPFLLLLVGLAELSDNGSGLFLVWDGGEFDGGLGAGTGRKRENVLVGDLFASQLEFFLARVALFVLATAREDNQAISVFLETLDIGRKGFLGLVDTAVVDSNANGRGLLGVDTCSFEFSEGETTARTDLDVVLLRLAAHNGTEHANGAGSHRFGLGRSGGTALLFLDGLIKVGLDEPLPILAEVRVWNDVVVFDHLLLLLGFLTKPRRVFPLPLAERPDSYRAPPDYGPHLHRSF